MYTALLTIHSLFRWVVLISLVYSIVHNYRGYKKGSVFNKKDDLIRHSTATIAHIQMSLGLGLYFISPFVISFFQDMGEGLHLREIRFFAIEHGLMMLIAVIIITIGSMKAKRKSLDSEKFKTTYVWYLIALIIILLNIPWEFSPLVNRPSFRGF